ncbi:MAG TPA: hypothetical protein VFS76_11810, partial [Pyrinomonadaceae bacterium]|nr:hypothetical protein [Pyrinomonadaceae bacterium]
GVKIGTYRVGKSPSGIAFDGTNIWVTNFYGSSVTQLRASDGAVLNTIAVADGPVRITLVNGYVGGELWQ